MLSSKIIVFEIANAPVVGNIRNSNSSNLGFCNIVTRDRLTEPQSSRPDATSRRPTSSIQDNVLTLDLPMTFSIRDNLQRLTFKARPYTNRYYPRGLSSKSYLVSNVRTLGLARKVTKDSAEVGSSR